MSSKKQWIRQYFSEDDLKDIRSAVNDVESKTIGEILLSFRNKKTLLERLYSDHELAMKDFDTLGVARTKERTGILVFLIFEQRYFDIIADEGIYKKIPDDVWNEIESKLKEEFREKNYAAGIVALINRMGEILSHEFPVRADSANDDELNDEIVIN
ncbi:MAG: TPM domain-containing protein [Ignavibacteria bacterium]|nr:TPM domain-containing protein [Ignavibacteria bacterium]